jgi:HSP20 family protein
MANAQSKPAAAKGAAGKVETKEASSIDVAEARPRSRLAPLWDMERDMQDLFENFFSRGWLRAPRWELPSLREVGSRMPKVDVIDRETEIVVEAELPGVNKEDVEVTVTDNSVTLKATSTKEETEEKGDYHRREISRGYFSRTLPLPADVKGDKAQAEFKDGVLRLTIPKAAGSKRHSIKVQ